MESGHCIGQVEVVFGILRAVAFGAVLIEDWLDVGGVVQYPRGGFVAGLGLGFRWWMQQGHRRSASRQRGVPGFFVASDAGAYFSGAVIHIGSLALDFEEVLIERLEVDVFICGDEEVGGAVFINGDYAVYDLEAQACAGADEGCVRGVFVARVPESSASPWSGDLLHDTQVFYRSGFYIFEAVVDVLDDTEGQVLLGELRVARHRQYGRFLSWF